MIAMLASFILSCTLVPTMAKYMMRSHHVAIHEPQQHGQPGAEQSSNVFVRFQKISSAVSIGFARATARYWNGRSLVVAPSSPFHLPSR